jgi:2,4-dienoyl-CoA reductase-like NADH-dependent reductase (Old Yellow Enzyme family)
MHGMTLDAADPAPSPLLTPIALGQARAVNRVAMAPMTNKQSHEDGRLSPAEIEWLGQRAEGGFGVVITGGWAVAPEGRTWHGQAALYDERHEAPLIDLARRITATPALGIVQLIHGGSRSTRAITNTAGISASDGPDWAAASETDIERLLEAHRVAARRVRAAGLHGVEIHGAHGFLPAQFISRTGNTRDDRWGGDLAGRSRFVRELVKRIRDAVGDAFVIGVRLSPVDERRGIALEETAQIAARLAEDGADYVHLSLGNAFAPAAQHALEVVRAAVPAAFPIVAAGGISSVQDAVRVMQRGANIIALGTGAILDPTWPRLAADPGNEQARPPFTRHELEQVGVTAPSLEYLRDDWPHLVSTGQPG